VFPFTLCHPLKLTYTHIFTGFRVTRGVTYSQRNKEFHLFLLKDRFVSQFHEYTALLLSSPQTQPPMHFFASFFSFDNPNEEVGVYPLDVWKITSTPTQCKAMDDRANKLVESFEASHSASTHLANGHFIWEGHQIRIMAEITLSHSNPHSTAKIVRHAVRIEKLESIIDT
jgi:hypothetical protein